MDIVGIGSAFVDYFFEGDAQIFNKLGIKVEDDLLYDDAEKFSIVKQSLPLLSSSAGGSTPNTLHILSKMGLETAYEGILGRDKEGFEWLSQLSTINTTRVKQEGITSQCACILTHNRTKRTFISYMNSFDNSFFSTVDTSLINKAKFLHSTQFFLDPANSIDLLTDLIKTTNGPKFSFSPGVVYTSLGINRLKQLLKNTYICFFNPRELTSLFNDTPPKASKKLLSYGPEIIVCTLGDDGCLITTPREQIHIKGVVPQKIVDTTSAGDTFAGAFLYGLIKGLSPKECGALANKIAAKSLENYGCMWMNKSTLSTYL